MDFMDYVGWISAGIMTAVCIGQLGTIDFLRRKLQDRERLLAETSRLLHQAATDNIILTANLAKHDRDYFDRPADESQVQ